MENVDKITLLGNTLTDEERLAKAQAYSCAHEVGALVGSIGNAFKFYDYYAISLNHYKRANARWRMTMMATNDWWRADNDGYQELVGESVDGVDANQSKRIDDEFLHTILSSINSGLDRSTPPCRWTRWCRCISMGNGNEGFSEVVAYLIVSVEITGFLFFIAFITHLFVFKPDGILQCGTKLNHSNCHSTDYDVIDEYVPFLLHVEGWPQFSPSLLRNLSLEILYAWEMKLTMMTSRTLSRHAF